MRYVKSFFLCLLAFLFALGGASAKAPTDFAFPKAQTQAKTLLAVSVPGDGSALTLAVLQGLLADRSDKNLLFRAASYEKWVPYTGAAVLEAQEDGSPWDLPSLLSLFAPLFDGYLLCDSESAPFAVAVAKQKNSLPVYPEFEETVKEAGLTLKEDLRGMTDLKFRRTEEFKNLRRDVAFEQPTAFAPRLLDYAAMCGAYVWYDANVKLKLEAMAVFSFLKDNAVVFGYNHDLGEFRTVKSLAQLNACLVPSDHAHNLSVLSGFPSASLKQKTDCEPQEGGRKVCLLMSDGDNLQWFLNSYADISHFGSPVRGDFPMAWGIPAGAADLTAPVAERYDDEMTKTDEFVLSLSGLGYTFPSRWKSRAALEAMADALRGTMERLDTKTLLVLENGGFASGALDTLLQKTGAEGIFFTDFHGYSSLKGKTRFVDGKPIVSARYELWNGNAGCSPEEIAAAINALPTDPKDPDAYAFVIVHAWSGLDAEGNFVPDGDTMQGVRRLVSLLDENTRVVTPTVFMREIAENLGE